MRRGIILLLGVALCECRERTPSAGAGAVRNFPEGLRFGAATASYQVEGAWNEDGKAPSIWDHVAHTNPCFVKDCQNGDVADDSYHQVERDVEIMRELGLDFYRFSLSWPRILPTSFPDAINEAGVDYYNRLIDELLRYNIEPVVTIFHWDLPQTLQDMGGWANPAIIDWYADYARVAFSLFGDRVKKFMTINEPHQVCYQGYGDDSKAPAVNIKGIADYMCARNLLLAHAKAYHIYDEEFRTEGGNVFIGFSAQWYEPASDTEADVQAASDTNHFLWGLYVHPIFGKGGDYPPLLKERVAAKSAAQGFPRTRLQEFTPDEITYIHGTSDLFGLNHYSTYLVYRNESTAGYHPVPSLYDDADAVTYQLSEWKLGESDFVKSVPWGFYNLLTTIREQFDNPPIFISENGYATPPGLEDNDRVQNYRSYLSAMLDAIDEGSDIRAYTAWSMMDNFEWKQGYTERFGLYEVDYSSVARTRTPRRSAFVYKQILKTRQLDFGYEPDTTLMTIDHGH